MPNVEVEGHDDSHLEVTEEDDKTHEDTKLPHGWDLCSVCVCVVCVCVCVCVGVCVCVCMCVCVCV